MNKPRPAKESDQENTAKACQYIRDVIIKHTELEPTIWCGAICSIIVDCFKESGFSHKEFCDSMQEMCKHYETWWHDD